MPPLQDIPQDFPGSGIDIDGAFSDQPEGSTRSAVNVRSIQPAAQRMRGGSRSGISKLSFTTDGVRTVLGRVSGQPLTTPSPVQMLVTFSTVGIDAHLSCHDRFNVYGGPNSEADTSTNDAAGRNPGRWRRVGGSGVQPLCREAALPRQTLFLQGKLEGVDWTSGVGSYNGTPTLSFASNVAAGSLVVVAFAVSWSIINSEVQTYAVSDSQGNTYTLLKETGQAIGSGNERPRFAVYYAFAATAGPLTVTVAVTWPNTFGGAGQPVGAAMAIMNYSGPTGPNGSVDLTSATGTNAGGVNPIPLALTSGTGTNQGHLVLGCFSHSVIVSPYTRTPGPAGFANLLGGNGATGVFGQDREMTITACVYPNADPLTATMGLSVIGPNPVAWAGIAVRFKANGT